MVFKIGDRVMAHRDINVQGYPPVVRTNKGIVLDSVLSGFFTTTTRYKVAFNSTDPEAKGYPVILESVGDEQITPPPPEEGTFRR